MHVELVKYWIEISALLSAPIAPHSAEHIYLEILKKPTSIQLALWPTPQKAVDATLIEVGQYMRGTVKMIRDAETALLRMLSKSKGKGKSTLAPFDPKKPKSVRIYVAVTFPAWQDSCVQVVKEAYDAETDTVDDAKVRTLLTEKGLIQNKLAMPFVQAFKVKFSI